MRDAPEVENSGKIEGAHHVSRGMLEFRADPDSPYHDKNFSKDKTVILYCASGGRAALSGKTLKDLGYDKVFNIGGFKDWAAQGGTVEKPIEPPMFCSQSCGLAAAVGGKKPRPVVMDSSTTIAFSGIA